MRATHAAPWWTAEVLYCRLKFAVCGDVKVEDAETCLSPEMMPCCGEALFVGAGERAGMAVNVLSVRQIWNIFRDGATADFGFRESMWTAFFATTLAPVSLSKAMLLSSLCCRLRCEVNATWLITPTKYAHGQWKSTNDHNTIAVKGRRCRTPTATAPWHLIDEDRGIR